MHKDLFNNGEMVLDLVSIHHRDIEFENDNVAILRRVGVGNKTKDYIVVNGFRVIDKDNNCDWSFAYQYDLESLTQATQLFIQKIS